MKANVKSGEFVVKVENTPMFRDIMELLKILNDENPDLEIAKQVNEIYKKHNTDKGARAACQNQIIPSQSPIKIRRN